MRQTLTRIYDYANTSLMFKLSSLFENSVTKVGGAETSKFGPIPLFGDFRSKMLLFPNLVLRVLSPLTATP